MITMTGLVLAFVTCVLVVTATSNQQDDEEKNENENVFRNVMCEKKDDNVYKEMDTCFELESQMNQNAMRSCIKKSLPESNGTGTELFNAACEDKALFVKFDECFAEYESDEEFKKQEEVTPDVEECYLNVLKKYNLQELLNNLEEF